MKAPLSNLLKVAFLCAYILTEWGVLDTEQLHYLLFPSIRVAQRRLTALYSQGKIKRNKQASPYFYYMVDHKNPLQRISAAIK